jgi:hypothetical protein
MSQTEISLNTLLASLAVGESRYLETTLADYKGVQRRVTLSSRYPEPMAHMRFSSSLYTAVSASTAGDVRYLVCIKRLA